MFTAPDAHWYFPKLQKQNNNTITQETLPKIRKGRQARRRTVTKRTREAGNHVYIYVIEIQTHEVQMNAIY